ncbi:MAG: NfeD family protein [Sphingobacteriales bacterium]|nr:MAG: NfeD family protein [Sphingobacteriales bacterium]
MESLFNPAVLWFIIGFVLFLLEFAVPGLILVFFAFGAWVVAIMSLFTDLTINNQIVLFITTSLLSVLFFRKWVKRIMYSGKASTEVMKDEFIGKTAVAETNIAPAMNGKVTFKGTMWEASSQDMIYKGENVLIVGNESIILKVKSTKAI